MKRYAEILPPLTVTEQAFAVWHATDATIWYDIAWAIMGLNAEPHSLAHREGRLRNAGLALGGGA